MKSRASAVMLGMLVLAFGSSLSAGGTNSYETGFDLTKLRVFYDDKDMDNDAKIQQMVEYLRAEISHPSKPRMGVGGGPIDTIYIQNVIITVMAQTVPQEALLKTFNQESDKKIRDRIMLALLYTGHETFVNDVRVMLQSQDNNLFRLAGVRALRNARKKDLVPLLLDMRKDTYSRIVFRDGAYHKVYPIRQAAHHMLANLGADAEDWTLEVPLRVETEAEALVSILDDENAEQCLTALRVLKEDSGAAAKGIIKRFVQKNATKSRLAPAVKEAQRILGEPE